MSSTMSSMFFINMGGNADKREAAPPAPAPPKFPVYLLPSFSMPFRRRRPRSSSIGGASYNTGSSSPPKENSVPSLGSSPTDSILSNNSTIESPLTPPTPSYFPASFCSSKEEGRRGEGPAESLLDSPRLAKIQPDTLKCSTCSTDLAFRSQIVSKGFTGRYGRAYLMAGPETPSQGHKNDGNLINIAVGKPESRPLVTGLHIVADIMCGVCRAKVGWKYIDAKEESQKYKVGKFILETQRVAGFSSWEHVTSDMVPELEAESTQLAAADGEEEPIVFDSEDEDECEDIFLGVWDPVITAKRRSKKIARRQKQATAE